MTAVKITAYGFFAKIGQVSPEKLQQFFLADIFPKLIKHQRFDIQIFEQIGMSYQLIQLVFCHCLVTQVTRVPGDVAGGDSLYYSDFASNKWISDWGIRILEEISLDV